ncbi:mitochondrial inner membrane protein [Drechmeria coniospora]|uniref:Sensitive to high expression protein 9, mitochondrial n=1 Tax=Drechmeria coniospora TaxID=98403 RepID=A0A151GPW7_DRECN|nr:mitochondrial inner membrane protein [Drechmeria coniospora]KYK59130.1 mitochondrial inner membrane protein [Drechmeria coniospora]
MQPLGRSAAMAVRANGSRLFLPAIGTSSMALKPASCSRRRRPIASPPKPFSSPYSRAYSTPGSTNPPPEDAGKGGKGAAGGSEATEGNPSRLEEPPERSSPSSELTSRLTRNNLNQRVNDIIGDIQSRVLNAATTFNDITGYSDIEGIKAENEALEGKLADAQSRVRAARAAHTTAYTKRDKAKREVATLLARQDSWSPQDLERFTDLYKTDHVLQAEATKAQDMLSEAEAEEQKLAKRLNSGIQKRYHEEQIWSDRIRRASRWSTLGLMGMNFLLFIVLHFVAEPWKREKLVKGVVAEEMAVLEEVRNGLEAVKLRLEQQTTAAEAPASLPATAHDAESRPAPALNGALEGPWQDLLLDPRRWQLVVADLCSERRIDVRMKDASLLALEAALAGAAIAGGLTTLYVRRT